MNLFTTSSTAHRGIVFLLIAVVTVAAIACSSTGTDGPAIELPSAQETLNNAHAAMASVPQFQFELSHPEGKTSLPGGLELRRAEGAVVTPDRLEVTAEADLGRIFVKVDAVVIEGETWMTNPLTRNWALIAPEDSPFSFLDPVRLVTNVLAQTTDPTYPASGGLSGNRILLDGKVPSEALQPLVGTVIPGQVLAVSLVVDAERFVLRSAVLTGRLQPEDEENYVRHITFDGFDASLVIEPPI